MPRTARLPNEFALPKPESEPISWLHKLTSRLYMLIRMLTETVNPIADGYILPVSGLPQAAPEHRGKMLLVLSESGDTLVICVRKADGTYEWKVVV